MALAQEDKKKIGVLDKLNLVGTIANKLNPVNRVQTLAGGKVGNLIAPIQDVAANAIASGVGMERQNKTAIGDGAFQYDAAANKPLLPAGTVQNSVKGALQNTLGWKPSTDAAQPALGAKPVTPAIASGTDGKFTNDATRQAETAKFLAADAQKSIGAIPATIDPNKVNAVQDPSTPQKTAPVSAENVAVNTPSTDNTQNAYGAYAKDLAGQSQALLSGASRTGVAEDGTQLDKGAMAIGAGLVARGLTNRAKTYADLSAQEAGTGISQQNANTSDFGARSQAAERLKESARQDSANQVDVSGKKISNEASARINNLQASYMTEKDPVKRQSIADQLTALTGKTTDKFTPVMGKDTDGNSTYLGAFDNRSGSYVPQVAQTQLANVGNATAPAGMKQVGTSGGKPVYEDAKGNRFQ